ncbi:hypothetical protein OUZ56_018233 [Daphnia magna]|uniref:Uncharacterized protein n=1 Tax=Daphnia magna TaxID=35525 RepID=A0ABQ9Z8C3_9CRUS|nr:hypothetical protein OUZ56_018233 [Daphnia magna]
MAHVQETGRLVLQKLINKIFKLKLNMNMKKRKFSVNVQQQNFEERKKSFCEVPSKNRRDILEYCQACETFIANNSSTYRTFLHPHEIAKAPFQSLGGSSCWEYANWENMLNEVLFAYRSSVHSSTLETPYYLVQGRDSNIPINEF